jgi:hypothetical protein
MTGLPRRTMVVPEGDRTRIVSLAEGIDAPDLGGRVGTTGFADEGILQLTYKSGFG